MRYSKVVTDALVQQIRYSLRTDRTHFTTRDGRLRDWFVDKLEGIAPVMFIDKEEARELLDVCYSDGMAIATVARSLGITRTSLYHRLRAILEAVIEEMPVAMAREVLQAKFKAMAGVQLDGESKERDFPYGMAAEIKDGKYPNWRLGGCSKCGGDLLIDILGAHGDGPEWVCFQCGKREPYDGLVSI